MKILAKNNRASFDFDIQQKLTAGMVLSGAEVKSIKNGNVSLSGSYVSISPTSISLINCHIGPYKYSPTGKYDPTHSRRLLLNKHEINSLIGKAKGLIIVPLEIFQNQRGFIKITIGLGRARKKLDKRAIIKKREINKEIKQHL